MILLSGACTKSDDRTSDGRDTGACAAQALQATPLDGEANLGVNATINLKLSGPVSAEDVALSLTPPTPTRLAVGPDELVFTPDALLVPDTRYDWEVTLCGEALAGGSFTPRAYGELVGPRDLIDRTFQLDTRQARWGLGAQDPVFIDRYGGLTLIEVTDGDAATLDLLIAPGSDTTGVILQSSGALVRAPDVPFHHNPYLTLSLDALTSTPSGGAVTLNDLLLELAFTNTGVAISDGRLKVTVDLREPSAAGLDERCAALEAEVGAGCAPCADGERACVTAQLTGLTGALIPGLHLVEPDEGQDSGP